MASIEKYIWPSENDIWMTDNDLWTTKDDTWYGKFVETRPKTGQQTFYRTGVLSSTGWEKVSLSVPEWTYKTLPGPNKNKSYIRNEPKDLGDKIAECDLSILYGG